VQCEKTSVHVAPVDPSMVPSCAPQLGVVEPDLLVAWIVVRANYCYFRIGRRSSSLSKRCQI
jgi:hypothetical protein